MGLLDSFTDWAQSPQSQPTADGLLAAGLGILAHNRGLTSGTQAIGMGGLEGLQQYQQSKQLGMQQQMQNAQLQQLGFGLAKNKMLMAMAQQYLGGGAPAAVTAPQASGAPATASIDAGGLPAGPDGSGAGVQSTPVPTPGAPPTAAAAGPTQQAPAQAPQSTGAPQGGPFGNMPGGLVAYGLMTDPAKLFETAAAQYSPTDLQKTMRAAGIDPGSTLGKQILQQNIAKTNYIAPVSGRPGGSLTAADGTTRYELPAPQPGAMWATNQDGTLQYNQAGQPYQIGIGGAADASRGMAAAQSGGKAQYELQDVWDPAANGGKGGMVKQSVSTIADTANGGIPSIPGMGMPNASMPAGGGQPPPLPAGMSPLSAPPGRPVMGYPGQIGQPGSVTPPAAPQPFAAAPPLGLKDATNAAQTAPSKQMADSYGAMSSADANYQQSREALGEMMALAQSKGASGTAVGLLPASVGTKLSADAARYQKAHANFVSLQGSALGAGGTDSSRETLNESVPTYDKPQSAMIGGLTDKLNNLDLSHIKTQFLTPLYQQGDEKGFTQQSAAFDQNVKPSMAPILQMSGDQQRSAVQAAVKANPAMRPNFEWAFKNGFLK